jgi:hypothetical protein
LYGVEELGNIGVEGNDYTLVDDLTQKLGLLNISARTEVEKAKDGRDVEHIDHRSEYTEYEDLTHLCAAERLVFGFKLLLLSLLSVEYLDYLHSREIFREENVNVRGAVLDLAVCAAGEFTEDEGKENNEGNKAKDHQREHVVEHEHRRKHAYDDKAVLDEVYHYIGKRDGYRIGIVGDARYQRSYGYFVELIVR